MSIIPHTIHPAANLIKNVRRMAIINAIPAQAKIIGQVSSISA